MPFMPLLLMLDEEFDGEDFIVGRCWESWTTSNRRWDALNQLVTEGAFQSRRGDGQLIPRFISFNRMVGKGYEADKLGCDGKACEKYLKVRAQARSRSPEEGFG